MPDNSLLYPSTPGPLQPQVKSDPAPPVLGNGPANGAAAYGALGLANPWTTPSTPSFLAPTTMAYLGLDTSGAKAGMLYNTQTGQWEVPPPDWGGLGGAHAPDFGASGALPAAGTNPAARSNNAGTPPAGNGTGVATPGAGVQTTPAGQQPTGQVNGNLGAPTPMPLPTMLKSGAPGTTGTATQPTAVAPGANGAYGLYGNLGQGGRLNAGGQGTPNRPDLSGLPDWLQSQYQDTVSVDEGGTQTHNWNLNQNKWGGFTGQDGKQYVQVGDPSSWRSSGDGSIMDRSKVTYDPNTGYITTADNLYDAPTGGVNYGMLAATILAGVGGMALGVGEGGAVGGATGGLSSPGGIAGIDALESGGTLAVNGAGTGVAPYVAGGGGVAAGAGGAAGGSGTAAGATGGGAAPAVAGATPPAVAGATPGAGAAATGAGTGALGSIINGAARIAGPSIISHILNPGSGGGTGSGSHPGTGTGSGGGPGTGNDALGQSLADSKPLADDARNTLLNHGKPTDDQTAAINAGLAQERQRGREAILQASINSGQGGADSMVVQDKFRAFDGQLETQRQELMQKQAESNTTTALSELGYISRETLAYAQLQFSENQSMQQLYQGIFESLGYLFGGSNGQGGLGGAIASGIGSIFGGGSSSDPGGGYPTDSAGNLQFDP